MARRLGKFIAATAISGAVIWGVYRQNLLVESKKAIDIEYQELRVPGRQSKSFNDILNHGVPVRSPDYTAYKEHVLCYNQEKKIPHWVLEVLTKENCKGLGSASREKSNFKSDPGLSLMFASKNDDYYGSGWSRGHMAAAGNHKYDQKAMDDTFFLSNIVPQDADNNSAFWNMFEIYCRDLTITFDKVWVVTGPLFLPQAERGKKYVKYQVIGKSEVAVPTHLFKIIVAETGEKRLVGAFVVPNEHIGKNHLLKEYQVPMEFVESKAGFQFFPRLDRKSSEDLCEVEGCKMKPWAEFELMFVKQKIESAKTLDHLERIWKDLKHKGLTLDDKMVEKYNRKKAKLKEYEKDVARRSG